MDFRTGSFDPQTWSRRAGDAKVRVVHLQRSWSGQPAIIRALLTLVGLVVGIGLALFALLAVVVLGTIGAAALLVAMGVRRILHAFKGERELLAQPRRRNVRVMGRTATRPDE